MKKLHIFSHINLQLCAEGGDGGDNGGESTGVTGTAAVSQPGVSDPQPHVLYGKQEESREDAAPEENQKPDKVDLDAEFDSLIKGKFKEQYGKRLGDTLRQRLKGTEATAKRMEEVTPILEALSRKHGVSADDIAGLAAAIEQDDSYFESEAMRRGMTIPQLKVAMKVERENAQLRQQMQERDREEQSRKTYSGWMQQAKAAKEVYPSLDLETELGNPQFGQLLMSGIDVKTAFEVLHKDEIIPAAMQYTAQKVEQKIANSIRSGRNRPAENGSRSQGAVVVKNDVSKLTAEDINEIVKRVTAGERISF